MIIIISISTFAEYFFGMTYKLYLQADQKTYIISIIQIFTYILYILVTIIFAKFGANVQIIKLVSGLIFVLRPMIQNYYVRKKYNISFNNVDNNFEIKQKWNGLAQHIASVVHNNTDVTVLTIFSNLSLVSIYSVYYLVVRGLKSIILSFTSGVDAIFGDMIAKKETSNLRDKFNIYEVLYNFISTILFSCAIVLIVPFISVYTIGVDDANYIQPLFGLLIVLSEFIWSIRQSYNELIKAAGHFKETQIGAWIECCTNILISIILVKIYGLVGVAIGTLVAMIIRTIELVYHSNKYILERSVWISIKKILIVFINTLLIVFVCKFIPYLSNTSYINWVYNALMVLLISIIISIF